MSDLTVELSALGFQALITALLALVYLGLWRHQRRASFATWAGAWAAYAVRLVAISCYLVGRRPIWLFIHQASTVITACLLLLAALQFSRGVPWRRRYLWLVPVALLWSHVAIDLIADPRISGTVSALLLSFVTLWTAVVFWRREGETRSSGARILAWTFTLWGLHHLDYPLLRALGSGVLWGVFADVLFIVAAAVGSLFLVLNEGRRALETRSTQLEQLTHLLLRAQEDERRRIARELHDEAGQILTAVKIELDLEGRKDASEMVARALGQVRDVSNLLRPTVLDDLGLVPAIRALAEDFARRTRIDVELEGVETLPPLQPEREVVLYRVVQEALTNVARHSGAHHVNVQLGAASGSVHLEIEDDGRGTVGEPIPNLGLLGMRERILGLGGSLSLGGTPGSGFRIAATIPAGAPA